MQHLLKFEGGYANTKDDNGGETFAGITRKYHPELKIWKSIDKEKNKKAYKPTEDEFQEIYQIYYLKYYSKVNADFLTDERLAYSLFDFAVNAGVVTAVKTLQKILGITVDGKCGQQTISTSNAQSHVFTKFVEARKCYYNSIVEKNPSQKKFQKSWLRRASFVFE